MVTIFNLVIGEENNQGPENLENDHITEEQKNNGNKYKKYIIHRSGVADIFDLIFKKRHENTNDLEEDNHL